MCAIYNQNFKIFARGQSRGRKHQVILSRLNCQGCRIIIYYALNCHVVNGLPITARQYGEVVLPDAASGHDPDTLATKLSRCKEGTAQFLPSEYKFYRSRACRGTSLISGTDLSRCNKCYKWVLAQCRGTSYFGASKLSRYRILIVCRWACPGARTITKLSRV